MKVLAFVVLCLAVYVNAKPSGHWDDGHWDGHWDDGHWGGHDGGHWDGHWDDGHWDDGSWDDGHWGHHSNVVHGNGATLVGPAVGHAVVHGPVAHGHHGAGAGWGVHGGWADHGHGHGVVVKGPHTVPATIVGPSGKVHADGLWGPTHAHGGHHGHW